MNKSVQLTLLIGLITSTVDVMSANWTSSQSVNLTTVYSDNTALANDALSQSEITLQIRPSIGIKGEGARLSVNANYSLGAVIKESTGGDLEDSHFLNATAKLEAIEDFLFIDFAANAGISSISSTAVTATDISTQSTNTTQTYSFSVSPYVQYHFGQYADALLNLNIDSLTNQSGTNTGSGKKSYNLSFTSGKKFKALTWKASLSQSWLKNDSGREDKTSTINTDFQFPINRSFTADFSIGYEKNDILTNQFSNADSMTWDLGTTWTPNPRTTLKISYGDRFHGKDWLMDLKYRHRRSVLTASYSTSLTNSRTEQLNAISGTSTDINGNFVTPVDQNLAFNPLIPSLTTENIVQSQFMLAYQFSSRRTTVSVDTTFAQRKFQLSGLSTENLSTQLSLSRKLTPLTSLNSRIGWVVKKDKTNVSDQELMTYQLGLSTNLGAKSTLSVDYQYSDNNDSTTTNDYTENRISAALGITF